MQDSARNQRVDDDVFAGDGVQMDAANAADAVHAAGSVAAISGGDAAGIAAATGGDDGVNAANATGGAVGANAVAATGGADGADTANDADATPDKARRPVRVAVPSMSQPPVDGQTQPSPDSNQTASAAPGRRKQARTQLDKLTQLNWRIAAKCLLVGLIGGVLVSLYRLAIVTGLNASRSIYAFATQQPLVVLGLVGASVAAGFAIYKLVKWEPMASGSGIPQTEGVLSYMLKMRWWSILVVRYIGGLVGALFGLSLGREGPSVQVGACAGSAVRKGIGHGGMEENCLVTAGAAAGLAAAFTAPLSGVMFALEEEHRSFSPYILTSSAMAALVAAAVASFVFGLTPVLQFGEVAEIPIEAYLWMIPVGLVSGLVGVLVNRGLLVAQNIYAKMPAWLRPMVALLIAIPFGLLLPDVLGGGDNLVAYSESAQVGLATVALLFVAKVVFTCTSFGSGTPGGIFMPTLAIGALSGALFGCLMVPLGMPSSYVGMFALCAMAGTFTSAVKAPFTGILLVVEMSGVLSHMLPLAIVTFVAMFVSDLFKTEPIYSVLLDRYIDNNGKDEGPVDSERLFDVIVRRDSQLDGAMFGTVRWPEGLVVIRIQKAERAVMPRFRSRIRHGDHLIAVPVGDREAAKRALKSMAMPFGGE